MTIKINNKKLYFIVITVITVVICGIIYFSPQNGVSFCPSRFLGIYCSACGITRAIRSIMHLDIVAAFNYNQFFVLSIPLYMYIYIGVALKIFKNINIFPPKKVFFILIIIYFTLFLIYGILRNIEIFSFFEPQ